MNMLFPILIVIFATFISAFGSLYLKKGAAFLHRGNLFRQFFNKKLMLGVFLFLLSSVFYIYAMNLGELSLIYPITSLSYVWISFLSARFLGERMNSYKWAGILFIILGVILINHA